MQGTNGRKHEQEKGQEGAKQKQVLLKRTRA